MLANTVDHFTGPTLPFLDAIFLSFICVGWDTIFSTHEVVEDN